MFSSREKCTNSATKNGIKETQGKKPWVFLRLWVDFAGKNSGAEIEGNRLNWLMCQENIGGRKVKKIKGFDENWPKICSENNSVI